MDEMLSPEALWFMLIECAMGKNHWKLAKTVEDCYRFVVYWVRKSLL